MPKYLRSPVGYSDGKLVDEENEGEENKLRLAETAVWQYHDKLRRILLPVNLPDRVVEAVVQWLGVGLEIGRGVGA